MRIALPDAVHVNTPFATSSVALALPLAKHLPSLRLPPLPSASLALPSTTRRDAMKGNVVQDIDTQ
jgi:hypothetical protein